MENAQRSDGILNMSYRQSPNKDKVKVYFEKKGQQQNQFNDLMNNSFRGSPKGENPNKDKSFRMAPNGSTRQVDITTMIKIPERHSAAASPMTEHTGTEQ